MTRTFVPHQQNDNIMMSVANSPSATSNLTDRLGADPQTAVRGGHQLSVGGQQSHRLPRSRPPNRIKVGPPTQRRRPAISEIATAKDSALTPEPHSVRWRRGVRRPTTCDRFSRTSTTAYKYIYQRAGPRTAFGKEAPWSSPPHDV